MSLTRGLQHHLTGSDLNVSSIIKKHMGLGICCIEEKDASLLTFFSRGRFPLHLALLMQETRSIACV